MIRLRTLLFICASAQASAALAQQAENTELPPVNTNPAVTVFDEDLREVRYLQDPQEILRHVPNAAAVTMPGFGSGNVYTIRGLRDVGTYVDGVRLDRIEANHVGLFHADEIAVARGAMPLTHARPAADGGVHVRLRRPGTKTRGRFEGLYGEFDRLGFRGSLDAISANKAFGVTFGGYYETSDGPVRNLTTGEDPNGQDRWGGRMAVRISPSDSIDWHIGAAVMHDETLNLLSFDCGDRCDDRFATTGFTAVQPDRLNPFGGAGVSGDKSRLGLGNEANTMLLTSDFEWRGETIALSLVTGFVDTDHESAIDFGDGRTTPVPGRPLPPEDAFAFGGNVRIADESLTEVSQDIRLSGKISDRLGWTIGAALYERKARGEIANLFTLFIDGDETRYLQSDRAYDARLRGRAAYAGLDYIGDDASLSFGLRYADEDADFQARGLLGPCEVCADTPLPVPPPFNTPLTELSDGILTGYLSGRLGLGPEAALFASVRRGFASAIDRREARFSSSAPLLAPSKRWSYEGGIETGLFGGGLNLRLTGFYLEASDVSIDGPRPADRGFESGPFDFSNYGAEAEITAQPLPNLNLYGTFGWQNAEYDDDMLDADDRDEAIVPVLAPDLTASGGISYDWYVAKAESFITPSIGFTYRGDMEIDHRNFLFFTTDGVQRADARVLVDAGLSLRTDDDWWIVSIECDNCLDETYVDSGALGYAYLGQPRTWTFRARRKF
ncbi:TonB-dependent receptor plug domain-containing protein [Pacificimonas sp. WHA3]|uniref:TonB-dependent receptor plug domain-containing protein n=1 Tax=Pacificimonas pallii TaxID=2827236 RepID=A0ABS6SFK0_9SPHN|nr:TonB-dependent receptor plug domain-containing protein [Pacificimonas pallii]MBV7257189.1 TonB-dependent receptor plug domain-containing protein [Pacificimonas pallii]